MKTRRIGCRVLSVGTLQSTSCVHKPEELKGRGPWCFIGCKDAKHRPCQVVCEISETRRDTLELVRRIDSGSFEFGVRDAKVSNSAMDEYKPQLSQWTVVHEAAERGHSDTLSGCLVQGSVSNCPHTWFLRWGPALVGAGIYAQLVEVRRTS